jgi:hypothetical protein
MVFEKHVYPELACCIKDVNIMAQVGLCSVTLNLHLCMVSAQIICLGCESNFIGGLYMGLYSKI